MPKRIGITASSPLISDWKGSTPSAACLNIPTLIPQMTKSVNRFLAGAALGSGILKAESMRPQLEALGILKDDEMDTERLGRTLMAGFEQAPEVSFLGLTFDRDDADEFLKALNVQPS